MAMLLLPSPLHWAPLQQTAGVLVLGQGFATSRDFLTVARKLVVDLTTVPPFTATANFGRHEGRLAVVADAATGLDLRLVGPTPAAPHTLRLDDGGTALDAALNAVTLPFLPGDDPTGAAPRASAYWSRALLTGPAAKLVVILRRPAAPADARAELVDLPVVAVDVGHGGEHLVVARALAQLIGGLADEYTRSGPEWAAPPAEWLADPVAPDRPPDPYRLGRNTLLLDQHQRDRLGIDRLAAIVPDLDHAWLDGGFDGPTPFRLAPGGNVAADADAATIRLVTGAAGFRSGVFRCDAPCLLVQVPGPERDAGAAGSPVGTPAVGLCPVCTTVVTGMLGSPVSTEAVRRRSLDQQLSEYEAAGWIGPDPTRVPVTAAGAAARTVSGTTEGGAVWTAQVAVTREAGLVITGLKLQQRPGDPMAASEDVAESITFAGIAYDVDGQLQALAVGDALDNTDAPPELEVRTGTAGRARLGVRLRLHWRPRDGLGVHADLSLVCRSVYNDFDPGGAAEACKFYPQLTLRWSRRNRAVAAVRRLSGEVVVTATNRLMGAMGGHDHGHPDGMVPERQTVMLLADSNASMTDHVYDLAVPVTWLSGRLMGNFDSPRGLAAFANWLAFSRQPVLPEWSWLFDYGRRVDVGAAELTHVVVWESADTARGARRRTAITNWPLRPDPALGGAPAETVVKLPRQGGYDNIHVNADMGLDTQGRAMIAAPFCADVCLHLHVRWGTEAAAGAQEPLPFLGWSDGPHAMSHSRLGAPLVPPNQRITFGVQRPDTAHTRIRYAAEIVAPIADRRQVVLEQGLGFAFTYNGLAFPDRAKLAGAYGGALSPLVTAGFVAGTDAQVRQFFRTIYERIRFYSYGFAPGTPAPQQIPVDVDVGPAPTGPPLQPLVDL
jgi:hypothetical protein